MELSFSKYASNLKQEAREQLLLRFRKEVFDPHPEVEAVSWIQYTPSFNDGGYSSASIGELYFKLKGDEEPTSTYEFEDDSFAHPINKMMSSKEVKPFLLWLFGEGQEVIITPDELHTAEHDGGY